MDGHAASPRHKTHDLISRHRAAALGKMNSDIVKSLDNDSALGALRRLRILVLGTDGLKNLLVRDPRQMITLIFLLHPIDNLAFL